MSAAYRELVIKLVGEKRVGQFAEVELAQGAHTVDVLEVHILGQVRNLL